MTLLPYLANAIRDVVRVTIDPQTAESKGILSEGIFPSLFKRSEQVLL